MGNLIDRRKILGIPQVWDDDMQAWVSQWSKQFLKGPIPWGWVARSWRLPSPALLVGLILWKLAGMAKSKEVLLGNKELDPFNISRSRKSRALKSLEQAGLILVRREPGRLPVVTIIGK